MNNIYTSIFHWLEIQFNYTSDAHIYRFMYKRTCDSTVKFIFGAFRAHQCKQFNLALFYILKHSLLYFQDLKQFSSSSFSQKTKILDVV